FARGAGGNTASAERDQHARHEAQRRRALAAGRTERTCAGMGAPTAALAPAAPRAAGARPRPPRPDAHDGPFHLPGTGRDLAVGGWRRAGARERRIAPWTARAAHQVHPES